MPGEPDLDGAAASADWSRLCPLVWRRIVREEAGVTPVVPAEKWRGGSAAVTVTDGILTVDANGGTNTKIIVLDDRNKLLHAERFQTLPGRGQAGFIVRLAAAIVSVTASRPLKAIDKDTLPSLTARVPASAVARMIRSADDGCPPSLRAR